jgi:hypothetical protein
MRKRLAEGLISQGQFLRYCKRELIKRLKRLKTKARAEKQQRAYRRAFRNANRFEQRTGLPVTYPGFNYLGQLEYWDFSRNEVRLWGRGSKLPKPVTDKDVRVEAKSPAGAVVAFWVRANSLNGIDIAREALKTGLGVEDAEAYELQILEVKERKVPFNV